MAKTLRSRRFRLGALAALVGSLAACGSSSSSEGGDTPDDAAVGADTSPCREGTTLYNGQCIPLCGAGTVFEDGGCVLADASVGDASNDGTGIDDVSAGDSADANDAADDLSSVADVVDATDGASRDVSSVDADASLDTSADTAIDTGAESAADVSSDSPQDVAFDTGIDVALDVQGDVTPDGPGTNDDPCVASTSEYDCSGQCAALAPQCAGATCSATATSIRIPSLPFTIRTPAEPGTDPACTTLCSNGPVVYGFRITVGDVFPQYIFDSIKVTVDPPWSIVSSAMPTGFCSTPRLQCAFATDVVHVVTTDPHAPSRNVSIVATKVRQCP